MIKSKLEFRVGNRLVSQQEFFRNIEAQVIEKERISIIQKIKSAVDPMTGNAPIIRSVPGNPLQFEVTGTQETIARLRAKLKGEERSSDDG